MKCKNILLLILIVSMLFVNSSFVYAQEIEMNESQFIEISEENFSDGDTYTIDNVDISNFNGYTKPNDGSWHRDDPICQKNYFSSYYFYNLEKHFGENTNGSCGYVAAAMMLSYYDTYWDDNIIDEHYDEKGSIVSSFDLSDDNNVSPGIEKEPDTATTSDGISKYLDDFSTEEYWDFIEDNYGRYFQLYLIKIAEEQFNMYHNTFCTIEENGFSFNSDCACASTMNQQKNLIEYYLYQERGYNSSQVSLEYANTDIRNFAINKIKNGQPVMLLLGGDTGFHFVVAYDLDNKETEDNSDDTIYAHYGWDADDTHIDIDTDDNPFFISAMAINFADTVNHSHSNNYIGNYNQEYCSCFYSNHPAHECIHYTNYNETYHTYACDCNSIEDSLFEHDMALCTSIETGKHGYKCSECGYIDESSVGEHSYDYWVYLNSTTHVIECGCGARGSTTAPHAFQTSRVSLGLEICLGCGYTRKIGSDYGNIIYSTSKVSLNGSYILPDGTIMLVDEDVEAYLNGTLVFYDNDNLPQTQ